MDFLNVKNLSEKILDEIVAYIYEQHQVTEITFSGDLNSTLHEDDIQEFYNCTGLYDVFSYDHNINEDDRETTFIQGVHCIDTLAMTNSIVLYDEVSIILNFNEVVVTDHRAIMADLNINANFQAEISEFDSRSFNCFNPRRKSHHDRFCEKVKELVNITNLEKLIEEIEKSDPYKNIIEHIDREFTYMFDAGVTFVARPNRTITNDKEKNKLLSAKLYWDGRMKLS